VITAKSLLTCASWVALGAVLLSLSGMAGQGSSQVMLAFGAIVALTLTRTQGR
jgi:hypothetical protein